MTGQVPNDRFRGALPASRTELRLYRDRLEYESGGLSGLLGGSTVVDHDGINLVLRRDRRLDRLVGAASYDLVRSGESTVRLQTLSDPEDLERVLATRVPSPRERVDAVDEATVREALQRERVAWRRWPDDEPLPRSAVVTDADLVATYRATDRPEPPKVTRASDAEPSSVTAVDIRNGAYPGGASGGDADFTGGSTRHSPGHTSDGGAESKVGNDAGNEM